MPNKVTNLYFLENEKAFSLSRQSYKISTESRKVEIASLTAIINCIFKELIIESLKYAGSFVKGWDDISKLGEMKGAMVGKNSIVIGNGPSQGILQSDTLAKFKKNGNDIFAVNFWPDNIILSKVTPTYLVISDGGTLPPRNELNKQDELLARKNEKLTEYLLINNDIKILAPLYRVKLLRSVFGEHRVIGFVDNEMKWLTSNIDPRFPRGYSSMTLYKALALAIYFGYDKTYLLGMDNTYPRDVFCNQDNKIFNLERHAGTEDFLFDQSLLYPSMDVWAQDIFRIFFDLRKCFKGRNVINLDCYSLTDVFPKISNQDEINDILS